MLGWGQVTRPLRRLRGDGPGHVVRRRQPEAAFGEILGVSGQSLLDPSRDLLASRAERNDPSDVWEVSPPLTVFGLLVDDHVLAQRKCSKPLAFLMLPSVPTGTVALLLPATTIRSGRCGCAHTSCEPRWRTTSQPASCNAARTSRYFFGIEQDRTPGSGGHGLHQAEDTERLKRLPGRRAGGSRKRSRTRRQLVGIDESTERILTQSAVC